MVAGLAGAAGAQTAANPGTAAPGTVATDGRQTTSPSGESAWQPGQSAAGTMQPQSGYRQADPGMREQSGMEGQASTGSGLSKPTRKQPSQGMGQTASSSPLQVRQAQERLHALGLYKGPTDGMMDPDTRAAIANFQQQNGIKRTAELDQATLDRLMAGQPTGSQPAGSGSSMPPNAQAPAGTLGGAGTAPTGAGDNTVGQPLIR